MSEKKLSARDIVIVASVVVNLVLVLYIIMGSRLQPPPPGDEPRRQAQRDSRDPKRGEEDPYIANQVRNTIIKKVDEIQPCYKEFIARKPKITDGRVVIDWQVDPKGQVLNPELVSSQLGDPEIAKCMTGVIQKWTFPPPPSGENAYVVHKFNFKKE